MLRCQPANLYHSTVVHADAGTVSSASEWNFVVQMFFGQHFFVHVQHAWHKDSSAPQENEKEQCWVDSGWTPLPSTEPVLKS